MFNILRIIFYFKNKYISIFNLVLIYYRLITTLGLLSFYIINTSKVISNKYLRSINSKVFYFIIKFNIKSIIF